MKQKTIIRGKSTLCGVNDPLNICLRDWPLPYGVSYNSYLIDDGKVALIDTVDICYFEVFCTK